METRQLCEEIKARTYRPSAVLRVHIPKPGRPNETRPLGIPTVRDRVVQRAMLNVIEPILDHQFHDRSFGFRHGVGARDALRVVEQKLEEGYVYVSMRISYFDTIPKIAYWLWSRSIFRTRGCCCSSYFLIKILEELREWTPNRRTSRRGSFASAFKLYLNPLDHQMAADGFEMVRYDRPLCGYCVAQAEAEEALQLITDGLSRPV